MSNNPIKQVLPTTAELYEDNIEAAFKNDQFNLILNSEPRKDWIKQNKFANNSSYIPVGVIETLLQKIFKKFRVEILREGTMFNSVYVAVRIHYWNGIDNTWSYHDGIGGVQLQVKSGSSPAQMENINNNAVMMALPMAKSYAIKDACEHFGKLFGRDLNRKETMSFEADKSMSKVSDDEWQQLQEMYNAIEENMTEDEKISAERILKNKEVNSYNKLLNIVKSK